MLTWKTKAEWDVLHSCCALAPLLQSSKRGSEMNAHDGVGAWVPLLFLDVLITLVRLK